MLLIKIAVYVLCAALSLPIFPYIIWSKQLIRPSASEPEEEENSLLGIIRVIFYSAVLCGFSVIITHYIYEDFGDGRQIWYIHVIPFCVPFFMQFLYACILLIKKFLPIVLSALAIAFFLSISMPLRDCFLPYQNLTYLPVSAESEEPTSRIDDSIIQERYKTTMVSYQGHKDDADIYVINGKDVGLGVLTVYRLYSKYDSSEGPSSDGLWIDGLDGYSIIEAVSFQFYPCNYSNAIKGGPVRDCFKTEEIVSLGIVFDGKTPYGKFGILKRDGILERPQIDYYVFLNMVTGEIESSPKESIPLSI